MTGSWLDRNRNVIFVSLLLLTFGGIGVFYLKQPAQAPVEILAIEAAATVIPTPTRPPSPTPGRVRVYVTGAVVSSDVYFLPRGSIVKDAILAAGGLTADAAPERINQALELKDQQQIHVPRQHEEQGPPPIQGGVISGESNPAGETAPVDRTLVNINTATLEQLDTLPGIGPVIAQRIIDYRANMGEFQSIETITEVSGIGEATFAKIKELITIE